MHIYVLSRIKSALVNIFFMSIYQIHCICYLPLYHKRIIELKATFYREGNPFKVILKDFDSELRW